MKYSIVIPIYNCERFLENCIESVLKQETKSEYEIILVDDGSIDGSGFLCDILAEKNTCIRVIHQCNQGVSAARNAGMCVAEGEYILFLDADDLWSEELLCSLDRATEEYPDIIQFGYSKFFDDCLTDEILPPPTEDGESGRAYLERTLSHGQMPVVSSWSCAYRRAFLSMHKLEFPVGISYAEDYYFRMCGLSRAQRVCGVNAALYRYRMNEESATHKLSVKKLQDMFTIGAEVFRQFSKPILADYYCMRLICIADLNREEAIRLKPLLIQNRDVLEKVQGTKPRIARMLFRLFGWYNGARIIKFLVWVKNQE